jgi:type II secretory pathway component PulF
MADGIGSGLNATKSFLTNHWLAFAVVAFVVVALALSYDHKNGGKLSAKIASLPIIGGLFS